ncbi:MAG: tyrosine-type recombinase/integrase [Planctomycetaceae bacterium]
MARMPKPWYRKERKCWFVTIDGVRHNLGPDRTIAFQMFHELMATREKPKPKATAQRTVAEVLDAFLEWCLHHREKRTYEWYLQRCEWFVKEASATMAVDEFRPYHVQQWIDAHPHWSNGHRRGCITAIQRPFRWAEKMGLIDRNPIAHIEKPQQGRRDQIITPKEYKAILKLVQDVPFRDLLTLAWETGARPQELIRVEARHFDPKHSRWVFPLDEAKGKKRVRIVYLTEKAKEITQRHVAQNPEGPVLRNRNGRPWKAMAINCRFNRIAAKLGTKYCLYLFRHSFATRMLEKGLDAITVSTLMGHADTTMLGKVYQHLSHNPQHLLKQIRMNS